MNQSVTSRKNSDHVVIITGGARGIGHAFAHRLAEDGFHVAIVDLHGAEEGAQALVRAGFSATGHCMAWSTTRPCLQV